MTDGLNKAITSSLEKMKIKGQQLNFRSDNLKDLQVALKTTESNLQGLSLINGIKVSDKSYESGV